MSGEASLALSSFKEKGAKIFDPDFFGMYSFEYAYRLLLVYLSTNTMAIKGIRMSSPNAFDEVFKEEVSKAIGYILNYRGVSLGNKEKEKLTDMANESLVLFVKSPMSSSPQKLAKSVAKNMDKEIASIYEPTARSLVQHIFEEERL